MLSKLIEIVKVTQVALDKELMELREIAKEDEDLRLEVQRLSDSLQNRIQDLSEGADFAGMHGADIKWQHWVQLQQRGLNARRAVLRVSLAEQKLRAQTAFGRQQAAQQLLEQERDKLAVQMRRRV